jgi:hypothetical protein
MKKYLKQLIASFFLIFLMSTWNGCDAFNSLPLNIPFTINVEMQQSNGNSLTDTEQGCLSGQSDTYSKYNDKINSLKFVEAAFRTISVSPANLSGNVNVMLLNNSGNTLFNYTIQNVVLADYMKPNSPFILKLTQSQIDFINSYLDEVLHGSACFTATVTVDNLNGQPPYTMKGAIDMVIEADTHL